MLRSAIKVLWGPSQREEPNTPKTAVDGAQLSAMLMVQMQHQPEQVR